MKMTRLIFKGRKEEHEKEKNKNAIFKHFNSFMQCVYRVHGTRKQGFSGRK